MSAITDAVYDWLHAVFPSIQWIFAEQNIVPPTPENENFGMYRIVSMRRQGIDGAYLQYDANVDKFDQSAFSVRDVTISIDVFTVDDTAEDILNQALVMLTTQDIKDIFNIAGFGILGYTEPRNLSQVISGRYSRRFQSDLSLGVNLVYTNQIDRVVTVPYSGDVNDTTITGEVTS